jgi:glutamyl endopeptidase
MFTAMLVIAGSVQAETSQSALISGDGKVVEALASAEAEAGSGVVKSFKGSGGTSVEALAAEGVVSSSIPASQLMALKPMTADVGIESVLGFDSRVQTYTNRFPQRAIGLITKSGAQYCTGWLIGNNTVVTAGHCVATGGSGKVNSPSLYRFYAGQNGTSSPYGYCTVKGTYAPVGWVNQNKDDYDYGFLKLNCTVGNTVGTFGYFYTTASLSGQTTVISGYPGDKPKTQWESVDEVRVNQSKRIFYKNDTIGGQSGSPVWSDRPPGAPNPQNGVYAMGIHAYGTYNGAPFNTHNHATRIDQSVFNNFNTVRNLP